MSDIVITLTVLVSGIAFISAILWILINWVRKLRG